ncbi:(3S)-malyl-CoA thioesterase [Phreatobacter oligotrophus]|uniref:(3S)-malyl-CoA thioesterase n=1 Tax=Phreatobacter oligotrophus TaxID=1122261 RepID=A0A2T4YYI0_9HYPH|nr:(3S)-malyl-CoA thioesterase [Phreatobacter oligotrophus]
MAGMALFGKGPPVRQFVIGLAAACAALIVAVPATAQTPRPVTIVALGDSLTAGYQLPPADAFPVKLQAALRAKGVAVTVENAGVSGDTSSGGLDRLDWAVGDGVDAVILELGANDALRGIDPAITRRNLDAIITRLKERNIPILLTGMIAPPNMGSTYGAAFNPIFPDLAAKHGLLFDPFFLEGVAAERDLNLADGMHPNGRGVDVIVRRILPKVEELIAQVRSRRGG